MWYIKVKVRGKVKTFIKAEKKKTYIERPFSKVYCSSRDQSTAKAAAAAAASCLSPTGEFRVRWNPEEAVMLELLLGTQ